MVDLRVRVRIRVRVGSKGRATIALWRRRCTKAVWCCLCWRDWGVIFDRVRAELFARSLLGADGGQTGWLVTNGLAQ